MEWMRLRALIIEDQTVTLVRFDHHRVRMRERFAVQGPLMSRSGLDDERKTAVGLGSRRGRIDCRSKERIVPGERRGADPARSAALAGIFEHDAQARAALGFEQLPQDPNAGLIHFD